MEREKDSDFTPVIMGTREDITKLPDYEEVKRGDSYVITGENANGHLYVWMGSTWLDIGKIAGEPGIYAPYGTPVMGEDGKTYILEPSGWQEVN